MMFSVSKSVSLNFRLWFEVGRGEERSTAHTYIYKMGVDRLSGLAGGSRRVCGFDMARPTD
jgi:hypothetical protein